MKTEPELTKKLILVAALLIAALLSVTVVSDYAVSAETHSGSIAMLDEKKMTAMELTAAVAITSTAITALPGDAATPIAEQISELATPLLIVICAIYLEQFLLTTVGYLSFSWLVPAACGLFALSLFRKKESIRSLATRLLIFALAIFLVVPASVKVMELIEATFEESISQTMGTVEEIADEAEKSTEEEDQSGFLDFLAGLGDKVTGVADSVKNALGNFVDAIAVMLITTCIIPIVVLIVIFWIVKLLFGVSVNTSAMKRLLAMKAL